MAYFRLVKTGSHCYTSVEGTGEGNSYRSWERYWDRALTGAARSREACRQTVGAWLEPNQRNKYPASLSSLHLLLVTPTGQTQPEAGWQGSTWMQSTQSVFGTQSRVGTGIEGLLSAWEITSTDIFLVKNLVVTSDKPYPN